MRRKRSWSIWVLAVFLMELVDPSTNFVRVHVQPEQVNTKLHTSLRWIATFLHQEQADHASVTADSQPQGLDLGGSLVHSQGEVTHCSNRVEDFRLEVILQRALLPRAAPEALIGGLYRTIFQPPRRQA